ncbi:MAG TPA: hypothetical protein VJS30_23485 [Paraburkholderia sp.]|nr:hypothetical protein [Paraburkholderia sp.]
MKEKEAQWLLPSGVWAQTEEAFVLTRTALDRPVSAQVGAADIAGLVGATFDDSTPPRFFPPEFSHSPSTGKSLRKPSSGLVCGWAPPSGNAPVDASGQTEIRGLRRTPHRLLLQDVKSRLPESDPDDAMEMPPAGDYQFFSTPLGATAAALIAFDPTKGTLFAWLPASRQWQPMEGAGGGLVEVCELPHHAWRAEMAKSEDHLAQVLFVPTDAGLARIRPDVASMTYEVDHIGGARAVGAPVAFDNRIWIPVMAVSDEIRFIGVDPHGTEHIDVTLDVPAQMEFDISRIGLPVSYNRIAVWGCKNGQLRLQKQADNSVSASFERWPANVVPHLDYGSPYLSRSGELWQACFNTLTERYVWVRIDRVQGTPAEATTLRLCSGKLNFRITSKTSSPPWEEPEHSNDTASNDFIIPLLESSAGEAVIGLRLASESGIAKAFELRERVEYTLCFEDANNEVAFSRAFAPEPWRIRLFIHNGMLWAYHAQARRIEGWKLA